MTGRLLCIAVNPAVDRLIEVEQLVPGDIHRPSAVRVVPSGKALNVARAAAALGAPVTAVGLLRGHNGRWLAEAMAATGVDARFTWGTGETRIVTSVADRATTMLTEFYEYGDAVEPDTWDDFERLVGAALGERPAVAAMGGSLPPGVGIDAYSRLVAMAGQAGIAAAVDVGSATATTLGARPWLVKANALEASAALGLAVSDLDSAIEATSRFASAGAAIAVITLGVDGAVVRLDGETWRVGSPPRLGAYPVGSGDAFLAGLLVARLEGAPPADQLALATAAATANALEPGAGELDPALARALAGDVRTERVG